LLDKGGGENPDMASGLSAERAARNESVFRNANERIEQRVEELSLSNGRSPFLCECEDPLCSQAVRLTAAEYEAVRAQPTRFVVAGGHPIGDADVVTDCGDYRVIEKRGTEGAVAAELDPRQGERAS
jgi:hypothetical protein